MHEKIPGWLIAGLLLIFSALPVCGKTLTVGVVPQFETGRLYAVWGPILNELSRQTGVSFSMAGAPSIPAFERAFMNGEYDIAYMNPYHYIVAARTQGYVPLVRDVGRSLRGVLVVARDSGISAVAQLAGKTIAFPSPNALGAALQMRQELHDLFGLSFTPEYVKTHDSVYLNVLLGKTAAGGGTKNPGPPARALQRKADHHPHHPAGGSTSRGSPSTGRPGNPTPDSGGPAGTGADCPGQNAAVRDTYSTDRYRRSRRLYPGQRD